MNPLLRTVHSVLETNINGLQVGAREGQRTYNFVKYVTGKKTSHNNDYNHYAVDGWHGYDSVLLTGKKGFVRLALLTPLFKEV